ncbi:MAG: hypothetical protein J5658_03855 [Prevotella sp.]|nr:hypothetical protein [Prevotella sp.]
MTRYAESDIPAYVPEYDKELIRKANNQCWEDIEPDDAISEQGRIILHDIAVSKYHRDECSCGME